jgi:hypothetical protein
MDKPQILTPSECDQIIAKLDECLAPFERRPRPLNDAELRAKTLLIVMRNEFLRHSSNDTVVPFE